MRITAVAAGVPPRVADYKAPPLLLLPPAPPPPPPPNAPPSAAAARRAVTPPAMVPLTGVIVLWPGARSGIIVVDWRVP